ncbi:MAG: type IX secretion system membrane protein PorP/SprF [Flavobacteriales bacterium]|nr:type IX secretion system membrane protein PorP/SprF [Flavobacteriales bacterium]
MRSLYLWILCCGFLVHNQTKAQFNDPGSFQYKQRSLYNPGALGLDQNFAVNTSLEHLAGFIGYQNFKLNAQFRFPVKKMAIGFNHTSSQIGQEHSKYYDVAVNYIHDDGDKKIGFGIAPGLINTGTNCHLLCENNDAYIGTLNLGSYLETDVVQFGMGSLLYSDFQNWSSSAFLEVNFKLPSVGDIQYTPGLMVRQNANRMRYTFNHVFKIRDIIVLGSRVNWNEDISGFISVNIWSHWELGYACKTFIFEGRQYTNEFNLAYRFGKR